MLRSVGFKLDRVAQNAYLFAVSDLIVAAKSGSSGTGEFDHVWAALTAASGGVRPGGGATAASGSKEVRKSAHRNRRAVVMLDVLLA